MPQSNSHDHIRPGARFSATYTFTPEKVDAFNQTAEENNPLHADRVYAETLPWKRLIISGLHMWKPITNLFHLHFAPQFFASEQSARFRVSVYEGDTVSISLTCTSRKSPHEAELKFVMCNTRGGTHMSGTIFAHRACHVP
jgi:acyl dehydratase